MTTLTDLTWLREHTARYLEDPEQAHDWDATPVGGQGLVPTLLLTTTGRHSGAPRATPLLYQPTGSGFIVVASRGGSRPSSGMVSKPAGQPGLHPASGQIQLHCHSPGPDCCRTCPLLGMDGAVLARLCKLSGPHRTRDSCADTQCNTQQRRSNTLEIHNTLPRGPLQRHTTIHYQRLASDISGHI